MFFMCFFMFPNQEIRNPYQKQLCKRGPVLKETVLYTHGSCARGDCFSTPTAAVLEGIVPLHPRQLCYKELFLYTHGSRARGDCFSTPTVAMLEGTVPLNPR